MTNPEDDVIEQCRKIFNDQRVPAHVTRARLENIVERCEEWIATLPEPEEEE